MKKEKFVTTKPLINKESFAKFNNKYIWWWVGLILISALIIVSRSFTSSSDYEVGEICNENIYYSGPTMTYVSEVLYNGLVEEAKSQAVDVYAIDNSVEKKVISRLNVFIDECNEVYDYLKQQKELAELSDGDNAPNKKDVLDETSFKKVLGDNYSKDIGVILEDISKTSFNALAESYKEKIKNFYHDGISEEDWDKALKDFQETYSNGVSKQKEVFELLEKVAKLSPNYLLDKEATKALLDSQIEAIEPVEVTVRDGQTVAEKGQVFTAEAVEMLSQTGLLEQGKGILYYLGVLLMVVILYFLIFVQCYRNYPFYIYNRNGVLLIGIVCIIYLLVCQAIFSLTSLLTGNLYSVLGYLVPLPTIAIVFTTLIGYRMANSMVMILGLFTALLSMNQISFVVVALTSALFTTYMVQKVSERFQLIRFGFYIGCINALLIAGIGAIGEQGLSTIGVGMLIGFIGGIFSSLLSLGLIPLAEKCFGITTPMRLVELANPNHPLIHRLMKEAPGTYYHSVLVGNLAESAAEAIGADALFVRVASYFHDIGKIMHPEYFTENQNGINIHDKLSPTLSSTIIISHVRDGITLGEEAGLPDRILDVIKEHHGGSTVQYFYRKALDQAEEGEKVDIAAFTYPYPKPQTRESAIIMMADAVQAACRSLDNPSPGEIKAKIHNVIQGQRNAGLFMECDLTFRDLNKIQDAFSNALAGTMHKRVKYPTDESIKKNLKGSHENEKKQKKQEK